MKLFKKKKKEKKAPNNFFGSFPVDPPLSPSPPTIQEETNNNSSPPSPSTQQTHSTHNQPISTQSVSSINLTTFTDSPPRRKTISSPSLFGLSSTPINSYFGLRLEDLLRRTSERGLVPGLVENSVNYLLANEGFLVEGIFQIPGDNSIVQQIKSVYETGEPFDFGTLKGMCQSNSPGDHVRVVASLLWLFVRQLPDALLTHTNSNALIEVAQNNSQNGILKSLQEMVPRLPPTNREVTKRILPLLSKVVSHSYVNKLSAANIASIFAPCFVRARIETLAEDQVRRNNEAAQRITQVLIEFHSDLFGPKDDASRKNLSSENSSSWPSDLPQAPSAQSIDAANLQMPKRETSPQINRWKYQTFTHPSAEKLRNNLTSLPVTSPSSPSSSIPSSSASIHSPSYAASSPTSLITPPSPATSYPLQSTPTSQPSSMFPQPPSAYPQSYSPYHTEALSTTSLHSPYSQSNPTAPLTPTLTISDLAYSHHTTPTTSLPPPTYTSPSPIYFTSPTLSTTRIQEIIATQESKFRDMMHILQSTSLQIDKAIANNSAIGNRLSSLDEVLRNEVEVLHNILDQEKEKATLYAMS